MSPGELLEKWLVALARVGIISLHAAALAHMVSETLVVTAVTLLWSMEEMCALLDDGKHLISRRRRK